MTRFCKAEQWERRVQEQLLSGIGPYKWCKQNNIPYSSFQYWRKQCQPLSRDSFIEIPYKPPSFEQSGI